MPRGKFKAAVNKTMLHLEHSGLLITMGMPDDVRFISEQIVLDIIDIYDMKQEEG